VVADLVDVTRLHTADPGHRVPHLAFQPDALSDMQILPIEMVSSSYYLRLRVDDQPGVLADLARVLPDRSISIGSMVQQPSVEGSADIIFLTHEALEGNVNQAIKHIESLSFVRSKMTRLRMENLA
jgi:homoserine dehydrogenase